MVLLELGCWLRGRVEEGCRGLKRDSFSKLTVAEIEFDDNWLSAGVWFV